MPNQVRFAAPTSPDSPVGTNNNQRRHNETQKSTISCDSCRRRKIKCDKLHPCNQCISSFNDCTYSEPIRKRRRIASDQHFQSPNGGFNAMGTFSPSVMAPQATSDSPGISNKALGLQPRKDDTDELPSPSTRNGPLIAEPCASFYQFAEKGDLEFQGSSADRTFIQGLKHELGDWAFDSAHKRFPPAFIVPGLFDTSKGPMDISLPSRDVAKKLVDAALDAQIQFSVVHRPSFNNSVNLIYCLDQSNYGTQEWRFLALFYAVLAYGSLFVDLCSDREHDVLSQASQYYEKSIRLQDIAECKDLVSLQAIVFKIQFVLATTRVFTCYTYSNTALSVALRMGLHRSFTNNQDFISREIGKRVFWALWILANEIAASCGLPKLLSREDIDQGFPIEVDDIYLERGKIIQQPEGEFCLVAVANTYRRLHFIFQGVTKHIYSEKRFSTFHPGDVVSYSVGMVTLKGIEEELRQWVREIPDNLAPGRSMDNPQLVTAQFTLCISYAHAQLYLYRPFLRQFMAAAEDFHGPEKLNSPWLATICIQASENIIMLCEDMYRRGLLGGGNWLISRALFSSTLTLLYVLLTNSNTRLIRSISRCLALGRKVGDGLSKCSIPGQRWKVMVTIMIATLPSSSRQVQERLLELESKIPDLTLYKEDQQVPDDAYTASLQKQALNCLGSDSRVADKIEWLAPHLLEAIGVEYPQEAGDRSPLWRMCPKPGVNGQETSNITSESSYFNDYFLSSGDELGVDPGSSDIILEAGGMDFGNIDEFLDLQNWL